MNRRDYIGSTDSAPILALADERLAYMSKPRSAGDVWLRLVHGLDTPMRRNMERGLALETSLRAKYRQHVGACTDALLDAVRHPTLPMVAGTPDGLIGSRGVLELKSWSCFQRGQFGEPGTDAVPDKFLYQGQHHLAVTGLDFVHYVVSFGRDLPARDGGGWLEEESAVFVVQRDAVLIEQLMSAALNFWKSYVETGLPPPCLPRNHIRAFKRILKEQSHGRSDDGSSGEVGGGVGEGTGRDAGGRERQAEPTLQAVVRDPSQHLGGLP